MESSGGNAGLRPATDIDTLGVCGQEHVVAQNSGQQVGWLDLLALFVVVICSAFVAEEC